MIYPSDEGDRLVGSWHPLLQTSQVLYSVPLAIRYMYNFELSLTVGLTVVASV